jgi:flagellar basal body-associated protein FliL
MRGITMTKKGFVFIETIIVIVLLSVGIASMYSLMSNITTDIKMRKYFDNISDLYKTNIIRNNTNKNLTGSTYLEITKDNCTSYMSSNCNSLLTDLEVERVVINFTNLDNIINSDTTLPNSLNEYLKTINSYKTNKYIIVNYKYNNKNYYASLEVK